MSKEGMQSRPLQAFCSWCLRHTEHSLAVSSHLGRDHYRCQFCQRRTVPCRLCDHMAKGPDTQLSPLFRRYARQLCAEHDGSISTFERPERLPDITECDQLFRRRRPHYLRLAKYAAYVCSGSLAAAGLMLGHDGGAPAIAALLGSTGLLGLSDAGIAISSLSGEALRDASLAAIGGSPAAGKAVIASASGVLGGAYGGNLAYKYHHDDPSFCIRQLSKGPGTESAFLFLNGFLREQDSGFSDWQEQHVRTNRAASLYGVTWSSKSLRSLGFAFGKGVSGHGLQAVLNRAVLLGRRGLLRRLGPMATLTSCYLLAGNPWHVAMVNARTAGRKLADAIAHSPQSSFTLAGHSLGCRVIYFALLELANRRVCKVDDVILLGGAVGRANAAGWERAAGSVRGTIHNCFSRQDHVLKYLYTSSNLFLSSPIGFSPIIAPIAGIQNHDLTHLVGSHMTWKSHYAAISQIIEAGSSQTDAGARNNEAT